MNIVAHGLWGIAVTSSKNRNDSYRFIFWSVFPDLVWGIAFVPYMFFGHLMIPSGWSDAPFWFYHLYGIGHSVIVWSFLFFGLIIYKRKAYWELLLWLLHILFDIPGHTHFMTPFLYPLSSFALKGWFSWTELIPGTISFLVPVLIIARSYYLVPRGKGKSNAS